MKRSKKIYEGQRRHCCWCFSTRRWQVIRVVVAGKENERGTARGGVRVGLLLSSGRRGVARHVPDVMVAWDGEGACKQGAHA